ncbi:MAG: hypothetical protein JO089_06145 [Alphaproteobacteria bacterium]|nr:hypothetical protein [Alphaproteobacteria bacterium]
MSELSSNVTDEAVKQTPGFFHMVGSALRGAVGTALLTAAVSAAVAVVAGLVGGAPGVQQFLGQYLNLNVGEGLNLTSLTSHPMLNVGATAAAAGAIGGAALGALGGAVAGVTDIRKHYENVVLPQAEQASITMGKEIGARQKEQAILAELQEMAQAHQAQAQNMFEVREALVKRNPRYAPNLERDKAAGTGQRAQATAQYTTTLDQNPQPVATTPTVGS